MTSDTDLDNELFCAEAVRKALGREHGSPAQAATMSAEKCVWNMPSWPDSHVASDGIILALVHEQKMTAPISSGLRPALASAAWAASNEM